jgi:hypothetical protein
MQAPRTAIVFAMLALAAVPALACDSSTSECPCTDATKGECNREQRGSQSPAPAAPATACPNQRSAEPAKRPQHTRFLQFA